MSRKLYIVLFIAFVGLANCFPNEEAKPASETNKLETDDEGRIVGGQRAQKNQFPFMVSIQMMMDDGRWFPICGGSVISRNTILTAAHCMDPPPTMPMRIVAGSLRSVVTDPDAQIRKVKEYIVHEDFARDRTGRLINDICLLILEQPLELGTNVQPIRLSTSLPAPGAVGQAAGWGDVVYNVPGTPSHELLYVDATIYPISNCERVFGPLSSASQICVGKLPRSPYMQSVCRGDSGGPVVINNKVAGVVSYSLPDCGLVEVIFTAVNYFEPWVRENMV